MVIFREVIGGPVARTVDLGGDVAVASRGGEGGGIGLGGVLGHLVLRLGVAVDARAILGARVVALAVALGGIVAGPVHGEEVREGDDGGIPRHLHRLGVSGATAAGLLVGGVLGEAADVPHRGGVDAGDAPEHLLGAPEASGGEHARLEVVGEGGLDGVAQHEVLVGDAHLFLATGEGGGLVHHRGLAAQHGHELLHQIFVGGGDGSGATDAREGAEGGASGGR